MLMFLFWIFNILVDNYYINLSSILCNFNIVFYIFFYFTYFKNRALSRSGERLEWRLGPQMIYILIALRAPSAFNYTA